MDSSPTDEMVEIRRRMRDLEASLDVHEIDAEALSHEIRSPFTSAKRKAEAIQLLETALTERSAIKAELAKMYRSYPHLVQ